MILLNESLYISKGATRKVYIHPDADHLCIKVDINESKENSPTLAEAKYYRTFGKRLSRSGFLSIPKFHGFAETSEGAGGVFDLIRDEGTGNISSTLQSFIANSFKPEYREALDRALRSFRKNLMDFMIISTDLKSHNICIKQLENGEFQLICIDGIGNKELIPVSNYLPWFAHMKLRRHFKRYHLNSADDILAMSHTHPTPSI